MTQTPEDQSLDLHPVPTYVACRVGGMRETRQRQRNRLRLGLESE